MRPALLLIWWWRPQSYHASAMEARGGGADALDTDSPTEDKFEHLKATARRAPWLPRF